LISKRNCDIDEKSLQIYIEDTHIFNSNHDFWKLIANFPKFTK
jgi:hypothetical protein